jgi:pyruvate-ferredoxin/flavodoxin oxidoreductase
MLSDATIRAMIDDDLVRAHRERALKPRATGHPRHRAEPRHLFPGARDGEPLLPCDARYRATRDGSFCRADRPSVPLFRYDGHPEAERVAVVIGYAAETLRATVAYLNNRGERVGVLQVLLYRPWSAKDFLATLPASARRVAVLDRTKEPGAPAEPLCLDVMHTLADAVTRGERQHLPLVVGGRYGLSSKEFNPAMAKAVFDHIAKDNPHAGFTVGITDDVCATSVSVESGFDIEPPGTHRALFYGLGADGTVGANKNSVKILAEDEGCYAQGYFVYNSHKSGAETISHLRFGSAPIAAPYLLQAADFIGVHQFDLLARRDVLAFAARALPSSSMRPTTRPRCGSICRDQRSTTSSRKICACL